MWLTSQVKSIVLFGAVFLTVAALVSGYAVAQSSTVETPSDGVELTTDASKTPDENTVMASDKNESTKTATFGAGCFWCVEAVFQQLEGVEKVTSGYMGGQLEDPTYEQVCTGTTGHAEVIQISYDESKVSFETLLEVFWKTHDPTTLNRQGHDVGTQYRSAVFYHDENQKTLADSYNQNFWNEKGQASRYCQNLIPPKLEKLKKVFADKLKK